ncbi:MAG: biotin/lipoyl-binding protein [Acidimicrobiaceae bacterium]|nr:biotin/lipoyl-binding protein [Acidimicrobiaceae bacterium]
MIIEGHTEPQTQPQPELPSLPQPEKGTGKVEKLRGMNASLTAGANGGGGGVLKERDPTRLHITRRQIALALVLALAGVIAAIYTVNAETAGAATYAAAVTSSKVYDLNFPTTGKVDALMVSVGQRVAAGQVLARQDTTALQAQVASDEAVVKADQQVVSQSLAPQLTPAEQQNNTVKVQQAQTALANAQSALSGAEATGKASVAQAQAAVTAAQQLAQSDSARYSATCPNGPVAPAPDLSGPALQVAQANFTQCENLQQQMNKDLASVNQAQSQVPVAEAQAQQAINNAQAQVNSAQAAVNLAQSNASLQTSPTDASALAQAQAALSQAQGQLSQAQQALQGATLVAPGAGVVAEVFGAVGEYLGPDGVHQFQAPAAPGGNNSSSGFQLFPQQTTNTGGGSNSGGNEPLIEVIGGQQQVMAQVPESQLHSVPVGHSVHVSFDALHTSAPGTVTQVVLAATRNNTGVTYDVIITLNRSVGGLLPGMSAHVHA